MTPLYPLIAGIILAGIATYYGRKGAGFGDSEMVIAIVFAVGAVISFISAVALCLIV